MKIFITIFVLTSLVYAEKLTQDFLKGFETGILLRDDPRALHDYSCPEPDEPEASFISGFTKAITPMNMMAKMSKDARLESIASKITLFVTTLNDVMGIFDEAYDAGDFCRGLIFGKDGAKMLYEIAQSFVDDDERKEYNKMRVKQMHKGKGSRDDTTKQEVSEVISNKQAAQKAKKTNRTGPEM